jgi:hypothetical protein
MELHVSLLALVFPLLALTFHFLPFAFYLSALTFFRLLPFSFLFYFALTIFKSQTPNFTIAFKKPSNL